MLEITALGHFNIVVDDIEKATHFYMDAFGAVPVGGYKHLKNEGFAKSAGFLDSPERLDVSIRLLRIKAANIVLELMQYYSPLGSRINNQPHTNDLGGIRHICLNVSNIEKAFFYIKQIDGIKFINADEGYKPCFIGKVWPEQVEFFKDGIDAKMKQDICNKIEQIRFFYFIDPYGVQWELEEK